MSFKDYLNESEVTHEGFKIVMKAKNLSPEELEAFKSMIDLCIGYIKVKPCTIYIARGGRSTQVFLSATVAYNKNTDKMVQGLAHELQHVKQRQTGDMADTGEVYDYDFVKWKGKRMKIYTNGKKYEDSPWEVEAREIENKLYKMWKQFNR